MGMAVRDYHEIRSIMETPICDDHKWAKVPELQADAFILDIEDSAPPESKALARQRVVQYLGEPDYFQGRPLFPRCNHLQTPWGLDDVTELARAGADVVVYPKVRSAAELEELKAIFRTHGQAVPDIFPCIETASAVLNLEEIARIDGVKGLWFGPADLAVDAGFSLFVDGEINDAALYYPRMKVIMVAAVYGLATWEGAILPNFRDLEALRKRADHIRHLGFTGMITFYPSHIPVLNEAFGVRQDEIAEAEAIVAAYEEALREGGVAVARKGRALLIQDYKRAKDVLKRGDAQRSKAQPS